MENKNNIIKFLNNYLDINSIKDYGTNGLQIEGRDEIKKIAFGVSASLELFKKAKQENADMIIVHHGLMWGKVLPLKGFLKERYKFLLENQITLLAYHLPLDKHNDVGNNIQLAKLFETNTITPFGEYNGKNIGYKLQLKNPISTKQIVDILENKIGKTTLHYDFYNKKNNTIGIISGGASDTIHQALDDNLDLYITGDVLEYIQAICQESGINYISCGHYNSEKLGVIALMELIKSKFQVETCFIDIPNNN